MKHASAFGSGALFAAGLAVSGMIRPAKVIGFLDVAGTWDPTLAFVMAGAIAVFLPGYRLVTQRARPVLEGAFDLPKRKDITPGLVAGATLFGLGWGVTGLCPAAAIAALPALSSNAITVTLGMAIGIVLMKVLNKTATPDQPAPAADF